MRPRGPRDSSLGKLDVAAPRSNIEPRYLSSVGYIYALWCGRLVGFLEVHSSKRVGICMRCLVKISSGQLTIYPKNSHTFVAQPLCIRSRNTPSSSAPSSAYKRLAL